MKLVYLWITLLALVLGSCSTGVGLKQNQLLELSSDLESVSELIESCLDGHGLIDVSVEFDIVETDSLINPIRGLIDIIYGEPIAISPDGSPLGSIPNHYQIWFDLDDRGWNFTEVSIVNGRPIEASDRLEFCLEEANLWPQNSE